MTQLSNPPSSKGGEGGALTPRMVSIYELRKKLWPYLAGYAWAEDALMDLWKLGAPDPSPASMPCNLAFGPNACARLMGGKAPCEKWGCAREKRVLLPTQFQKWWEDVAKRQGAQFMATEVLKPKSPKEKE